MYPVLFLLFVTLRLGVQHKEVLDYNQPAMAKVSLHVYDITNSPDVKINERILQINKITKDTLGIGGIFHGAVEVGDVKLQLNSVTFSVMHVIRVHTTCCFGRSLGKSGRLGIAIVVPASSAASPRKTRCTRLEKQLRWV